MAIRAGEMIWQISIQRATETYSAQGAVVEDWNTLFSRSAKVDTIGGREIESGDMQEARITHQISVRSEDLGSVTSEDRVIWVTRILNIINVRGRCFPGEFLTFECQEIGNLTGHAVVSIGGVGISIGGVGVTI